MPFLYSKHVHDALTISELFRKCSTQYPSDLVIGKHFEEQRFRDSFPPFTHTHTEKDTSLTIFRSKHRRGWQKVSYFHFLPKAFSLEEEYGVRNIDGGRLQLRWNVFPRKTVTVRHYANVKPARLCGWIRGGTVTQFYRCRRGEKKTFPTPAKWRGVANIIPSFSALSFSSTARRDRQEGRTAARRRATFVKLFSLLSPILVNSFRLLLQSPVSVPRLCENR